MFDPIFCLLILLGSAVLISLVRNGPRVTADAVLAGFRWVGLLLLGLLLSAVGLTSLVVLLCALVAGFVLALALLLLVLLVCAWMLPVLVLGGVLVVGGMALLP